MQYQSAVLLADAGHLASDLLSDLVTLYTFKVRDPFPLNVVSSHVSCVEVNATCRCSVCFWIR
jgi:hypothetical protein